MFGKKIDLEEKNRYSEALKQKRFDLRNNTKKEPSSGSNSGMVIPKGVEPLIFWMRTRRPGPLDDGTIQIY